MERQFASVAASLLCLLASDVAQAGCAAPGPSLLFPLDGQEAPLNSRVTISLGVQSSWVDRVVLRPIGGKVVESTKTTLPGPAGQTLVQLSPRRALEPHTRYELAIIRPPELHPNALVFGTFLTGSTEDRTAPSVRVQGARYFEAEGKGTTARWVEIGVATADGDRAGTTKMFAIWFPDGKGRLDTSGPPALYVTGDGPIVRLSSPDSCGDRVPLPSQLGAAEFGIAALDEASNRGDIAHLKVDFRRVEHRRPVP